MEKLRSIGNMNVRINYYINPIQKSHTTFRLWTQDISTMEIDKGNHWTINYQNRISFGAP